LFKWKKHTQKKTNIFVVKLYAVCKAVSSTGMQALNKEVQGTQGGGRFYHK